MSYEFKIKRNWKNTTNKELLSKDLIICSDCGFIADIGNNNFTFWIFFEYDTILKYIIWKLNL